LSGNLDLSSRKQILVSKLLGCGLSKDLHQGNILTLLVIGVKWMNITK